MMTWRALGAGFRAVWRYWARPVPLTYEEVVTLAKAGEGKCDRIAYDLLGMVNCGSGEVFMALVRTSTASGWDEARGRAFIWPLMQDEVFVRKADVVKLNEKPGSDGQFPLQRAIRSYDAIYGVSWWDNMAEIVNAAHAAGEKERGDSAATS